MTVKVIYFLRGRPTEEQWAEARIMGAVFRNPDAVGRDGDFFEDCESVCGESIPEVYAHKPVLECSAAGLKAAEKNRPAKAVGRSKTAAKRGE